VTVRAPQWRSNPIALATLSAASCRATHLARDRRRGDSADRAAGDRPHGPTHDSPDARTPRSASDALIGCVAGCQRERQRRASQGNPEISRHVIHPSCLEKQIV
jgi:hypothetical protein